MQQTSCGIPDLSLSDDGVLHVRGTIDAATVGSCEKALKALNVSAVKVIDGSEVTALDSSGALFLHRAAAEGAVFTGFSKGAEKLLDLSRPGAQKPSEKKDIGEPLSLEKIGGYALAWFEHITELAVLVVDIIYWSIVGVFDRSQYRKGSFVEQAFYIGSTALPIVGTILFLIGVILALQSAAQLRQFGVTIFVVNLLAIGLAREFAPLMTAIIVSGRSGSAIASEIATMKFTEELDAIRTLGLNPIRFVVVPKFWAMFVTLPLLTVMALFIGLLGGLLVALTYMDLSFNTFMNQLTISLLFRDVLTGLIKSFSFAVIITIVGVYRGLNFSGGADGVGRATTSSVVTSIFTIIVMDSIWGIIFYFKW